MEKTVLVTGGTGFVGSHLVEALFRRGHRVRCLIRKGSDLRWIRGLSLEYVEGDVTESNGLRKAVEGVQWVFHVAGVTKAGTRAVYDAVNAQGTRNLMKACQEANPEVERVVLLSSLAAWGPAPPDRPLREEDPPRPVSHYGRSKLLGEKAALEFSHRIPLTILRPAAIYGPRDRDIHAFFCLMKYRLSGQLGGEERQVSLCHVADVVQALLLAAEKGVPSGEGFFLSDGKVYSWNQVTGLLAQVMGVRPVRIRVPVRAAYAGALLSEITCSIRGIPPLFNRQKVIEMAQRAWTCDIEKAKRRLDFRPSVDLPKGLRETFLWYSANGWL